MEKKWWKEAVGYQIYPKSFNDTNNDGIGDIRGVIEKLDYLEDLGVDLLWLCPYYKSPMDDNGYDVSDYYDIDPTFGNMDDIKELVNKAHEKGIRIIADLVLNHTSDEHPWFVEASESKDSKYRDFYIWADGNNGKEPTNWGSFFGGSAWKYNDKTDDYFMKIFSDKMPDLNWNNNEMRKAMFEMTNFWLDLGIDGFRVDAVAHIDRAPLEDSSLPLERGYAPDWSKFSNLPKLHNHLQEFRKETFGQEKYDAFTVGEVGGSPSKEDMLAYSGYDRKELDMVFIFDHNFCNGAWGADSYADLKTDLLDLKQALAKPQTALYGSSWNPIYWLNHDHPRVVTNYGDPVNYHKESAKMLCTAMYFAWGTPFIYNGEEIGMTNYPFKSIEDFNDVGIHNRYNFDVVENGMDPEVFVKKQEVMSRDNARTPMQWNSSVNAGFSNTTPWMKVNPNYKDINVADQQKDPDSILNYYKNVIKLRKDSEYKDLIVYGKYTLIDEANTEVYSYIREYEGKKILVVTNFFDKEAKFSYKATCKNILATNYNLTKVDLEKLKLRPFEAICVEI